MAAALEDRIIDQFVDKVVVEPGGCWGWYSYHNDRRARGRDYYARRIARKGS